MNTILTKFYIAYIIVITSFIILKVAAFMFNFNVDLLEVFQLDSISEATNAVNNNLIGELFLQFILICLSVFAANHLSNISKEREIANQEYKLSKRLLKMFYTALLINYQVLEQAKDVLGDSTICYRNFDLDLFKSASVEKHKIIKNFTVNAKLDATKFRLSEMALYLTIQTNNPGDNSQAKRAANQMYLDNYKRVKSLLIDCINHVAIEFNGLESEEKLNPEDSIKQIVEDLKNRKPIKNMS